MDLCNGKVIIFRALKRRREIFSTAWQHTGDADGVERILIYGSEWQRTFLAPILQHLILCVPFITALPNNRILPGLYQTIKINKPEYLHILSKEATEPWLNALMLVTISVLRL